MLVLLDLDHFGVVADQRPELATERLADTAHSAHRLEQRRLHVEVITDRNAFPQPRIQDVG